MKKVLVAFLIVLFWAGAAFGAAPPGTCTMKLIHYPNTAMRVLNFTFTASTDNSYPVCSTANATSFTKNDLAGYWISEVRTTPGTVTPPTDGTAITLTTTSPSITGLSGDLLAGIGVVSHTVMKRFLTPATLPAGSVAGAALDNDLVITPTGNSVASAVFSVDIYLWIN